MDLRTELALPETVQRASVAHPLSLSPATITAPPNGHTDDQADSNRRIQPRVARPIQIGHDGRRAFSARAARAHSPEVRSGADPSVSTP